MEKKHEKELLNPERELTMEDLVRFREMCRLENIITRFRDQKSFARYSRLRSSRMSPHWYMKFDTLFCPL